MILTKKLYLKRGFFSTIWVCLRYLGSTLTIFFKGIKRLKVDQSRKIGLPILTTKQDAIRMGHETPKADHAEANWVLDHSQLSKDKVISRLA